MLRVYLISLYNCTNILTHFNHFHYLQVIGENIIAIFEGRYWKTAEDKILVFGANYDTPAIAQGLTDNGSGATGLLELAKELSEMLKNGGSLLYTVILVAFDVQKMKHVSVSYYE